MKLDQVRILRVLHEATAAITSKFNLARLYTTEVLFKAGEGCLTSDPVVLLNQTRKYDQLILGF